MNAPYGTLYVVATPIGHLGDITLRALETLKNVDVIACEDTRHSAGLLRHYGIDTPCLSYHEHNETRRTQALLDKLAAGQNIALICDAGTPLISDPGYDLVRAVRAQGGSVVPIPGASAVLTALMVSGLPTDRFSFEGFLPPKSAARSARLQDLAQETRTLIFYEAPHRLLATLQDMQKFFGAERRAFLARELTKHYETCWSDTLAAVHARVLADIHQQRGECVIVVAGTPAETLPDAVEAAHILRVLMTELPLKQAAALTARLTGVAKNTLYQLGLAKQDSP